MNNAAKEAAGDDAQQPVNDEILDMLNEFRYYKEAGLALSANDEPDVDEQWNKLLNKVNKKKNLKVVWSLAASIAILISVSLSFYADIFNLSHTTGNKLAEATSEQPKAILITSNGDEIVLKGNTQWSFNDENGYQIVGNAANEIHYNKKDKDYKITNTEALVYNELHVPRYGDFQVLLSDGTKVWINSESTLKYPVEFGPDSRTVELTGEAYFEVASDKSKPFIVKTPKVDTEVLGTEFNVNAYFNEDLNVTLVEGKVKVLNKVAAQEFILKPGQNASSKAGQSRLEVSKVNLKNYVAWKDGFIYFKQDRLEDIFAKLNRWYNFEVSYKDAVVKDLVFRLKVDRNKNFSEVLRNMEATERVAIEIKGNQIIVSDVKR